MSETRISEAIRRLVRERAYGLCEYCLLHERDSAFRFHIDHVIAEKHEGPTLDHNLGYSCPDCNRAKGSDITTLVNGEIVRLFNPRIDAWPEHFYWDEASIRARTSIAIGTIRLLGMNDPVRLESRQLLYAAGKYPSQEACGQVSKPGSQTLHRKPKRMSESQHQLWPPPPPFRVLCEPFAAIPSGGISAQLTTFTDCPFRNGDYPSRAVAAAALSAACFTPLTHHSLTRTLPA